MDEDRDFKWNEDKEQFDIIENGEVVGETKSPGRYVKEVLKNEGIEIDLSKEETSEPETAGIEYVLKCGDETFVLPTKELPEYVDFGHEIVGKNELIRRSDAEEYYGRKNLDVENLEPVMEAVWCPKCDKRILIPGVCKLPVKCPNCGTESTTKPLYTESQLEDAKVRAYEGRYDNGKKQGKKDERQRIKAEVESRTWGNLTLKEMLKIIEGEN